MNKKIYKNIQLSLDNYFNTLSDFGYIKDTDTENLYLFIKIIKIIDKYDMYLNIETLKKLVNILYKLSCSSCFINKLPEPDFADLNPVQYIDENIILNEDNLLILK